MPKAGVTADRKRRSATSAKEEAKAPNEDGRRNSLLARYLRQPTANLERELVSAASNGELSTHDIQAALTAQIAAARKLLPTTKGRASAKRLLELAAISEAQRPVHVLLKQLIEALREVVMSTNGGGTMMVIELHWPDEYAGPDAGDDVRTKPPEGHEA